ncbi:MAG: type II toxin-antitoxin system HicB family antitoxin [Tagaea sp.]
MATKLHYYPAVIEAGEPGSNLGVFFPDLPGCVSAGDDVIDAVRNAEEALSLHLSGMVADGDPLPAPSALDKLYVPRGVKEVTRQLIRAEVGTRAVRLNISLDEALVSKADRDAAAQGYTRSGFIASLIRSHTAPTAKPKRRRTG